MLFVSFVVTLLRSVEWRQFVARPVVAVMQGHRASVAVEVCQLKSKQSVLIVLPRKRASRTLSRGGVNTTKDTKGTKGWI